MTNEFNVLASVYRGLLDILSEAGMRPDQVADAVGAELAALHTPQAVLSLEQISQLWQLGFELRGPTIGIEVAKRVKFIDFQDVGVFLASTENVADWLAHMDKYSSLFSNVAKLVATPTAKGLDVEILYSAAVPLKLERLDFLALFTPVLSSQYLDSPLLLQSVELTRPTPKDPTPWEEAFGAPVRWNAKTTKYCITEAQAQRKILTRNTQTKKGFQTLLDGRLQSKKKTQPLDEIRAAILSALVDGTPNVSTVSAALNLSARSLQRRLTEAQTSFSDLLSNIRQEQAKAYLEQNVPVNKIAQLLGYSDPAVFKRAFQRWTRENPPSAKENSKPSNES